MAIALEEISTITAKGQTTIPKAVRQALGVDYGGRIAFRVSDGGVTVCRADSDEDPAVESYLTFSVSGISKPVGRATLRMFATSDTQNGPAAYVTDSSWTETGITWANRPPRAADPVARTDTVTADTWVEFNVTAVVPGNGTYSFVLATGSADGLNFSARESGDTAPQLVITSGDRGSNPTQAASPVGSPRCS